MAGRGRQETFRQAVRDCQWQRVRQLVLQGSSLEQRDVAVSQAVSHSQWGLVSQFVQLGVSQKCRDLAVHKAVRYCLWDIVDDLVAAGVSSEKRDFLLQRGLRHGQWALVSCLLSLGVGLELRGVVVTTALEHGQWGLVLDALRVGVKQELVTKVFQEVVSQERWEHVHSLVKLFNNNDHTDFVLQEAIRSCQWVCVRQLIKTGLTPAQQGLVCREALEWAHLDCAVELLRQGCEQACAERIVLEVFRWKRRQDLIDLLKEDGIESSVRDVVLCTAKRHGLWDEYLTILKDIRTTEKEMADVITTALYSINVCVILRLFSMFTSARRVFKHVLLGTRFFDHDIITLHTCLMDDYPDLAFYMFTAQEMWEIVVGMFGDARLRTKDRRFSLRHAIKKGAWYFVDAIVCNPSASHNDRRYAFLQAARQGKWPLALKLSTYSNTISVRDKLFAFQTWLKLGLWECVRDTLREWEQPLHGLFLLRERCSPNKKPFVKCVLEESVIAGNLQRFLEVCSAVHFDKNGVLFVLQTAIKYDKCEFVLEFCRQERNDEHLVAAVKLATQHKKWHLLKDLFTGRNGYSDFWRSSDSFDLSLLWLCVGNVSLEEDAWQIVVPALNELCGTFTAHGALCWDVHENRIESEHVEGVRKLSEWCLVQAFWNAGLVFSVLADDETSLTQMIDQKTGEIDSDVFSFCFVLAARNYNWASAAKCLEELTDDEMENIVCGILDEVEFTNLIQACTDRGQYKMAVLIALYTQDWEQVENTLPQCADAEVIDSVIREASVSDKWNIVRDHLDRSSQDNGFLCGILQCAVEEGQSDICTRLLPKVDLPQAHFSVQSLFYDAVTSSGDREQMVKLCVQFGLSTHVRPCDCSPVAHCFCWSSPFKTALRNGQMPLVKLLYKAGACSGRQLFHCKQDSGLRNQLQGQGRHDIVEYLDHSATTPRTLQDLCRLQVSHHVGCHPGRSDRVMALDIPWPSKDLINFEDVLS
ncbi:uncharacterized protein [Littorina saxatilis]|uniref:SOCS box domain-containing protein n=1 Tax=Littorina saxatilis TaxID=31220 RepID=A0AAN9GGC8_9CAEN